MSAGINLDNVAIVLHRPCYPENIGAAARAMRNMGLGSLIVVDPRNCDLTRVLKMATHEASEIVEQLELFEALQPALAPFGCVVGTTARLGARRRLVRRPDQLAQDLIPISQQNRVALLFGPEDRGLTNEDLYLCHHLVNIPTAGFASLNLAQAVMVLCYELFKTELPAPRPFTPRLASRHELDGMYDQLKEVLVRISFVNPQNPDYWMQNIRRFFTRLQLTAGEVGIIRGLCRQVDWYGRKCYQDGQKSAANTSQGKE